MIVSDAAGNATDRMDFQRLTSAAVPLGRVEKERKKETNTQEDIGLDTITFR